MQEYLKNYDKNAVLYILARPYSPYMSLDATNDQWLHPAAKIIKNCKLCNLFQKVTSNNTKNEIIYFKNKKLC